MSGTRPEKDRWSGVMRDSRYVAFVAHFNGDRDYYECHEVMEELWLEEGRHPLLQGLLQAAVGLHHWNNGKAAGAVKLMRQALAKLAAQPALVLGLDLDVLRGDLDRSLRRLLGEGAVSDACYSADSGDSARFTPFVLRIVDPALELPVAEMIGAARSIE